LVAINRQLKLYPWQVVCFLGALTILMVLYFSWRPNRQVNKSWRPAAESLAVLVFSLAVFGRQGNYGSG
jgi:hypothetical protein